MRILLISDHFPPFIGGAHRQIYLLAHELMGRGHAVHVATDWHGGLPSEEVHNGVPVKRVKQLRSRLPGASRDVSQRYSPPFPDPVTTSELRQLIARFQPDIVHSEGWITYSAAMALWRHPVPLILSGRDYAYGCATQTLLYREALCSGPALAKCAACAAGHYGPAKGPLTVGGVRLGRSILRRRVNGLHSVSAFVQSIFERDLFGRDHPALERNGGPVKERVIPSFLTDQDDAPGDPEFVKRLPAGPYILFVGSLEARKGLPTLLAAYRQLASPPPLVVIGYVTWTMLQNFPPGVIVLRDVPHAEVITAWRNCLFGVVPSIWPDPSPGVIREALSQGKPVISTRIGGAPEMLEDGQTGLLVEPGDAAALAAAMRRLIADDDLVRRLGAAAGEQSRQYRASAVVPQFEQLYQQLVDGCAADRGQRA
jgi:glycosyltransferase involved in cell wall biosynthesis